MSDTILTAAEVEVLALYHPVNAGSTHYENCWKEHPRCALRMVAASHLALWRENEKAIDDEPEYPGEMPDEMYQAICSSKDVATEAMRITVRLAKQGIKQRMKR